MREATRPNDPRADWLRRAATVALAFAMGGCGLNRQPSAPQVSAPVPPSAPEVAASAPSPPPRAARAAADPRIPPSVARAIDYVLDQPSDHPRAAVVDFSVRSSTPRFHVIDRASGEVLQSFRVAHGHGSAGKRDDGYAEVFSNESGTNASSLGLYQTAETYRGVYPGLSMRLDGLSPTNSNARSRFIVIHEAWYMYPASWKGKKKGRPGLSDGCFVFSKADREATVIIAEANSTAEQTRGAGDAERNRLFAESYGKDPDFFAFYRSMTAYEVGLKSSDTRFLLRPDSDFFKFFSNSSGKPPAAPAAAAVAAPKP